MKDPRKAPRLPGIATHYAAEAETREVHGIVYMSVEPPACGGYAPPKRKDTDPSKTNCRRCFKTKAWRAAWKKLEEA